MRLRLLLLLLLARTTLAFATCTSLTIAATTTTTASVSSSSVIVVRWHQELVDVSAHQQRMMVESPLALGFLTLVVFVLVVLALALVILVEVRAKVTGHRVEKLLRVVKAGFIHGSLIAKELIILVVLLVVVLLVVLLVVLSLLGFVVILLLIVLVLLLGMVTIGLVIVGMMATTAATKVGCHTAGQNGTQATRLLLVLLLLQQHDTTTCVGGVTVRRARTRSLGYVTHRATSRGAGIGGSSGRGGRSFVGRSGTLAKLTEAHNVAQARQDDLLGHDRALGVVLQRMEEQPETEAQARLPAAVLDEPRLGQELHLVVHKGREVERLLVGDGVRHALEQQVVQQLRGAVVVGHERRDDVARIGTRSRAAEVQVAPQQLLQQAALDQQQARTRHACQVLEQRQTLADKGVGAAEALVGWACLGVEQHVARLVLGAVAYELASRAEQDLHAAAQ